MPAAPKTTVLAEHGAIREKCGAVASWINTNCAGKTPVMVGLLRGCVPFFAEVLSRVTIACETEFVRVDREKGKKAK